MLMKWNGFLQVEMFMSNMLSMLVKICDSEFKHINFIFLTFKLNLTIIFILRITMPSEILDLMENALEKALNVDFIELRFHERRNFSVNVKNGQVERIINGSIRGVCARSLVNGCWGFASTTNLTAEGFASIIERSIKAAKASSKYKRRTVKLEERKTLKDEYVTPMRKDPLKMDVENLVNEALEVDKTVRNFSKLIAMDTVSIGYVNDQLIYVSSDGARIRQRIVRCSGRCQVIAREGGKIAMGADNVGAQSGLEIFDETPLMNAGRTAAERAVRLVNARMPKSGYYPVVLENRIVGLLAHEAVGHTAEADLVFSKSYLSDKLGVKVASNLITLVDDGRYPRGYGTMMYDDEGTPTQRTVIIENGICKGFMHSRETAYEFGVEPTGNARAWTFEYDPLVRMRNTYIEPGDYSLEELIEDIDEGYYLVGGRSGQADSTGEFMFGVQEAIKIERGKLTEHCRGVTISGNAFEVLKNVDAIGKDFVMRRGMCGKEQVNYVGMGGATLRTKVIIGGGGR
ncbi:MAG: TldD/PmbA family protein [Candidatus Verstraetearchaeota archaeon]|nr:TldD/PmbA family protein [Candidatus Verstraetearchaeota archaeon]